MAAADEKPNQKLTDQRSPDQKSAEKARIKAEGTINEKLNEFVQKNRRGLLAAIVLVAVVLVGFIIGISVRDKLHASAFSKLDELSRRYEALQSAVGSDKAEDVSKQADITALLDDLAAFQKKNSGFAAAKAYGISADIYAGQKKWAEAEKAWTASSQAAAKTYLAPVAGFNAAVAAEEQGNIDSAIDLYRKALDFGSVFPAAARAQFSVGRLEESRNNKAAALEAYKNLVAKWPNDPLWTNLAQSRIVVLSK